MDSLVWLVRSARFVKPETRQQMIQAFADSEMPLDDLQKRQDYVKSVTHS